MTSLAFDVQVQLLQTCIEHNLDIGSELEKLGYTYDDLQYRHNPSQLFNINATYKTLKDYNYAQHQIPVVSFFSGSGGLDLGFEAAGFQHVAAIEIVELFCNTLRANRPQWKIFGPPNDTGDVREKDEVAEYLCSVGVKEEFEGVFYGGPPCQPFSIAANQRFAKGSENFKRIGFLHQDYGNLLLDYIWYILKFKPRVFFLENVPGLSTIDNGIQLKTALEILVEAGYKVTNPALINASNYGVPQHRKRLIICGWRNSERDFIFPSPQKENIPSFAALRELPSYIINHETRKHEAKSLTRYMELAPGERDHLGRVDRLDPFKPSKTVIAGGTKGGGRSHLHPYIPRTLSVRECARLQTFPDDYIFCGSSARQFTQVGNAVPPIMAMKLARAIFESLFK